MKTVISGKKLQEVLIETVNMICDATSSTLGPHGNNVLINADGLSPFITNDGVTIARSIASDDDKINTVLEIVKEASLKTNEEVGDGTTTTLVLLQSIFNSGLKEIKEGKNPIILKKELDETLNKTLELINKEKITPSKSDLTNIASISANDEEIGKVVSDVFNKMGSKYAIKLEEGNSNNTYYKIEKGYKIDIDNIPSPYFKDKKEIKLNDVNILILRGYLSSLEEISEIINEGLTRNKNIVILASDFNDNLTNEVLLYFLEANKNIYLFKTPDFASRKESIEDDIAFITNAKIKNLDYETISWSDLGFAKNITIKKEDITIVGKGTNIKSRIKKLSEETKEASDYDKNFIENRIAKLNKGVATIYIGGHTKTEIREKLMRFDDALCALDIANAGIVYGEGLTYLKVSEYLKESTTGEKILASALQEPFNKIMENAGIEYQEIKKQIIESNYTKIFDFNTGQLTNIENTKIIDPIKVSIHALKNAVSIASLLLTTNYLVINENINTGQVEL